MQRLHIVKSQKNENQEASLPMHDQFRLFRRVNTTTYGLSVMTKLKDLGVARLILAGREGLTDQHTVYQEINQLRKQLKEMPENGRESALTSALERMSLQHKVGVNFSYPVMNPAAGLRLHLEEAKLSLKRVNEKSVRVVSDFDARSRNTRCVKRKMIIEEKKQELIAKYNKEIAIYEKEISNRRDMLHLLAKLPMPGNFKSFMSAINNLSIMDKHTLESLLTTKEQLSLKKESLLEAYELMFAYDVQHDDFVVGIRSRYDHDHPHPTLVGGEDPEVIVAGTIDIKLDGASIKFVGVRIDSGHFKPHAESLELIMRYIRAEMNPEYYDEVVLHTMEGDTKTPKIMIRK